MELLLLILENKNDFPFLLAKFLGKKKSGERGKFLFIMFDILDHIKFRKKKLKVIGRISY